MPLMVDQAGFDDEALLVDLACTSASEDYPPRVTSTTPSKHGAAAVAARIIMIAAIAAAGAFVVTSARSAGLSGLRWPATLDGHQTGSIAAAELDGDDEISGDAGRHLEKDIDFEYTEIAGVGHIDNIGSPEHCCTVCKGEPSCKAFTWVVNAHLPRGNPGQCWLKGGSLVRKNLKRGVFSAFVRDFQHTTITTTPTTTTTTTTEVPTTITTSLLAETTVTTTTLTTTLPPETTSPKTTTIETTRDPCSGRGEGCMDTKCCRDPGHQCLTKDPYWAQCMDECQAGPNPKDQVSSTPWECKALGEREPGKVLPCAKDGENCLESGCCQGAGKTCFRKDEHWASCRRACLPGPDLSSTDSDPWSCDVLGGKASGVATWVAEECAQGDEDCSHKACCAMPGHQCYKQSEYWAQCRESCVKGQKRNEWDEEWSCKTKGMRTPHTDAVETRGKVGAWVPDACSGSYENCKDSQCCYGVDAQCYLRDDGWAECKPACSSKPDPKDHNRTWDCTALGPRGWGLATKGWPSLYCISLFMVSSYERALLQSHLNMSAGIFSCDGHDVFAADPATLGAGKDGVTVKSILIEKIKVGVSQDGTAGNAKLFMAVWDKVIAGGRFRYYDWTIKVDPDAVLIAWRIREHLLSGTGQKVYVVNCNKFPGSPNFPMMYGAVEAFSHSAMEDYAQQSWKCGKELPWKPWGEDYYMTHCMDYIGVGRISDFRLLGDDMCLGANCGDASTASFHPFKSIGDWEQCWGEATAPAPGPAPTS